MNLSLMKFDIAHQDLHSEEALMNNITIWYNEAGGKKKSCFSSHLPAIFKIQSLSSEILIKIKRDRINNKAVRMLITPIFFLWTRIHRNITQYTQDLCNPEFVNGFGLSSSLS